MLELLREISKYSKQKFVEIRNGVPYYVSTGKMIPYHCIRMPRKWGDGLYALSKYTCGGSAGCRIGKPARKCIKRGIVIPKNCGKYFVDKIGNHLLSTNDVANILINFGKGVKLGH